MCTQKIFAHALEKHLGASPRTKQFKDIIQIRSLLQERGLGAAPEQVLRHNFPPQRGTRAFISAMVASGIPAISGISLPSS